MPATRTNRKPREIQSAAVYRYTCKVTKEVFYLVKSDSQDGVFYTVRFDHSRVAWTCSCPAIKPCKHERAVQEVLQIRRARIAAQMGGEVPAIVEKMQEQLDRPLADSVSRAEGDLVPAVPGSCDSCGRRVKRGFLCSVCSGAAAA